MTVGNEGKAVKPACPTCRRTHTAPIVPVVDAGLFPPLRGDLECAAAACLVIPQTGRFFDRLKAAVLTHRRLLAFLGTPPCCAPP